MLGTRHHGAQKGPARAPFSFDDTGAWNPPYSGGFSLFRYRGEAFDFLEERYVSSMRHIFQLDLLEGILIVDLRDLIFRGTQSHIYRQFYSHFTDEAFRRLRDP